MLISSRHLRSIHTQLPAPSAAATFAVCSSRLYGQSAESVGKAAADAANRLLLDEEVFLSQLHRRARLLNGIINVSIVLNIQRQSGKNVRV